MILSVREREISNAFVVVFRPEFVEDYFLRVFRRYGINQQLPEIIINPQKKFLSGDKPHLSRFLIDGCFKNPIKLNGHGCYLLAESDRRIIPTMAESLDNDENQAAADFIRQTLAKHEQPLPADVEEAWRVWSRSIQKLVGRAATKLRQDDAETALLVFWRRQLLTKTCPQNVRQLLLTPN